MGNLGRHCKLVWFLIATMMATVSCNKQPHADRVEIIALNHDEKRAAELRITNFIEQPNLPGLANAKMIVVSEARLNQDLIATTAVKSSSFADLTSRLQASLRAQPFVLDVLDDDNVVRSRTFESLLALTAFSHLERIFLFAEKYGVADSFKHRLNVAIYGKIVSDEANKPAISLDDNALYVGTADTVFLLPVGKEDGLPLTMHEGVLAHEFHHRVFFKRIWDNPQFDNLWSLFQSRYDPQSKRLEKRSRFLLNALDEGLADLFAVAFTGVPNYLSLSLTEKSTLSLRKQRDLSGSFATLMTYDILATKGLPVPFILLCGEESDNFTNPNFNSYCLGTVIAKTIFDAAHQDPKILRRELLPLISPALSGVAYALDRGMQFDVDIFLQELAQIASWQPSDVHQRLCKNIVKRFSSLVTEEKIPSCKNYTQ